MEVLKEYCIRIFLNTFRGRGLPRGRRWFLFIDSRIFYDLCCSISKYSIIIHVLSMVAWRGVEEPRQPGCACLRSRECAIDDYASVFCLSCGNGVVLSGQRPAARTCRVEAAAARSAYSGPRRQSPPGLDPPREVRPS